MSGSQSDRAALSGGRAAPPVPPEASGEPPAPRAVEVFAPPRCPGCGVLLRGDGECRNDECGLFVLAMAEPPSACQLPPNGWICTRAPGHDGPCAAKHAPHASWPASGSVHDPRLPASVGGPHAGPGVPFDPSKLDPLIEAAYATALEGSSVRPHRPDPEDDDETAPSSRAPSVPNYRDTPITAGAATPDPARPGAWFCDWPKRTRTPSAGEHESIPDILNADRPQPAAAIDSETEATEQAAPTKKGEGPGETRGSHSLNQSPTALELDRWTLGATSWLHHSGSFLVRTPGELGTTVLRLIAALRRERDLRHEWTEHSDRLSRSFIYEHTRRVELDRELAQLTQLRGTIANASLGRGRAIRIPRPEEGERVRAPVKGDPEP